MSLKLSHSLSHAPFFPPGISHHKVQSKDIVCKRPQSVKECKKMSKSKMGSMTTSLLENNDPPAGLRCFSKSTPNLKVCHFADSQPSTIGNQKYDNGLLDRRHLDTDHSPLYSIPGSFERKDRLVYQCDAQNLTRSLDRLTGVKRSKNPTGFKPDKPFYPPSKYPNIHDKNNSDIQRLIETRDKYKTPQSRKAIQLLARSQSMINVNKAIIKDKTSRKDDQALKTSKNYSSMPDLNKKTKEGGRNLPDQLSTSYFYPNQEIRNTNDIMVQSLQLERSLASMIGTGSLNRACGNSQYRIPIEIVDIDDNSTKSMTAPKPLNSFSQDSLSSNKNKTTEQQIYVNNDFVDGTNDEDNSQTSVGDISTTMSPLEDDQQKASYPNQSKIEESSNINDFRSIFGDHFQCKGELDQYNIDQVTNRDLSVKDFNFIDFSTPISIRNEFLNDIDHPIKEKYDNTLIEVLGSRCIVSSDVRNDEPLFMLDDKVKDGIDHSSEEDILENDHQCPTYTLNCVNRAEYPMEKVDQNLLNNIAAKCMMSAGEFGNSTFETEYNNSKELSPPHSRNESNLPLNDDIFTEVSFLPSQTRDVGNTTGDDDDCHKKKMFDFKNCPTDSGYSKETNGDISTEILETDQPETTAGYLPLNNSDDGGYAMGKNDHYDVPPCNKDSNEEYVDETDVNNYIVDADLTCPTTGECLIEDQGDPDYKRIQETDQYYDHISMPANESLHKPTNYESLGNKDHNFGREDYLTEEDIILRRQLNSEYSSLFDGKIRPNFNAQLSDYGNNRSGDILGNVDSNVSNHHSYEQSDTDSSGSSSTNALSWSGYDENKSLRTHLNNGVSVYQGGVSWLSSPELHAANGSFTGRDARHLQIDNPLRALCSYCHKPAYFMERVSISNIIFHKSCFRCRKCMTHLNFNNCIIHHKKPYCQVHMIPKIRRTVRTASTNKLNQIKEKLDNKSNINKHSNNDVRPQKRIFYEGIQSAKTKFFDDATKASDLQIRDVRRITPPREGVNYGVVESEPRSRDPNVIACGDYQSSYNDDITLLTQSQSTKETRAHFKELQNKTHRSKDVNNGDSDESMRSQRTDLISVDTKSLRSRFLVGSTDLDSKVKKINPSDEIKRLIQLDSSSVNDNESGSNVDVDVEKDEDNTVPIISRNKAKELKEKFSNFTQDDKPKKSLFKLDYGEGGVYESNPQENSDGVIKHNYDTTVYLPKNTVKSGLQRIKDLQDIKSKGFQKSNDEPFKLEIDPCQSSVYESTPVQSSADSVSHQNEDNMREFRDKNYTNEAKKVFLDKQKLTEEISSNRSTPHMIDIWKDLCPDSGVFENQPSEQRVDVIKYNDVTDKLTKQTEENEIEFEESNQRIKEIKETKEYGLQGGN